MHVDTCEMSRPEDVRLVQFNLRAIFLITAIIAVLLCLFKSLDDHARTGAFEAEINNNFKQIYLSLRNFQSSAGHVPPATLADMHGQPLASWRSRIMPYLEDWNMSFHPNISWTAPVNAKVRALRPTVYCWRSPVQISETNIFAVAGHDTLFDGLYTGKLPDGFNIGPQAMLFVPTHLIVLMEINNSRTHWMQPGDYNVADLLAATGNLGDTVHGVMKDRIHILFADGQVWALSPKTPMDAVKPFLTITAAKTANRQTLAPYLVD
jgi:hypothetical protein